MNEADDIDRAANLTQQLNDAYVEAARRRSRGEQKQNADGTWPVTECVDCGVDIPPQRLAMARIRCVECQEVKERVGRMRG